MSKKISWFFIGAVVYSMMNILLAMIVKRLDPGSADAFTFDFKLAQLLLTIGFFEVRVFQVTDANKKYSFGDYFGFRIICTLIMPLVAIIYFVFSGKAFSEFTLIILLTVYKMIDSIADVYEGDWQKNDHIEISGKFLAFRSLLATVVFSIVLYFTSDINIAGIALCASACIVLIFFRLHYGRLGDCRQKPSLKECMSLFKDTFLLAFGGIICMYLLNCSTYALDAYAPQYNYIFGALFMPAFVVNLMTTIFYKPILTEWSLMAENRDYNGFVKILFRYTIMVMVLTLVCITGAYLIGIPVLSALYATDLSEYKIYLILILIGGGLNALSILIYHGLVILRCQTKICVCYIITLVVTFAVPVVLAKRNGLGGAVYAFLIVMLIQTVILGILLAIKCAELRRKSLEK